MKKALLLAGGVLVVTLLGTIALALFERIVPRRVRRFYQKHIGGPLFRASAGIAPGWALIETTGRRTGLMRRTAVGGRLIGDTYWFIAGDRRSDFLRNVDADAHVRLRLHGRWRSGTARVCPEDDARKRLWSLNPVNGLFIGIASSDHLTVRVDLEPRR